MSMLFKLLISVVIFSFSSVTVAAGNPFTVKVSFYNQTGKTLSFYGHQHGFYDDLSIKPIKAQILNEDANGQQRQYNNFFDSSYCS